MRPTSSCCWRPSRSARARYHTGADALWHAHVRLLLAELGHPDPALLAHAPLAPLSADLSRYLRRVRGGADPAVIRATLAHLAAVLGGGPGGGR